MRRPPLPPIIRFSSSSSSSSFSTKPKWNSNPNLRITHPVLSLVESCASMAQLRQIQAHMTRTGLIAHRFPASRVLAFCALADPGDIRHAELLFAQIPDPNAYIHNAMIRGYTRSNLPSAALSVFRCVIRKGAEMDGRTFVFGLKACERISGVSAGEELVHSYIETCDIDASINLMNALVDAYGKFGCIHYAREVFDAMGIKDVFSWTSMLNAYGKCGNLKLAMQMFESMPERNAVSWSSMIAAYSQANQPKEALDLFNEMIAKSVEPLDATLVSVLSACSQLGRLGLGRWIYEYYINGEKIKLSTKLANAFIDMYAKCGDVEAAARLFGEMLERDIVTWNSMIMAYATHDYFKESLVLFEKMTGSGIIPDDITFVGVLSACSHGGLVSEGQKHFKDMKLVYNLAPKAEHCGCMIDLLGKVGLLQEAFEMIKSMLREPDEAGWGAFLNACRMHGNVELGKWAGNKLLELDPGDSGIYVLLSQLYATKNRWDDVKKVRMMMREKGVKKTPGCSSMEVNGKFHEFFVADTSHVRSEEIYTTLRNIYLHLRWEARFALMEEAESFDGLHRVRMAWRRLQRVHFGHDGEDLHSMTRRWQFAHTTATMFPPELACFLGSSRATEPELAFASELASVAMLSSRFRACSLGLIQLFFKACFLFFRELASESDDELYVLLAKVDTEGPSDSSGCSITLDAAFTFPSSSASPKPNSLFGRRNSVIILYLSSALVRILEEEAEAEEEEEEERNYFTLLIDGFVHEEERGEERGVGKGDEIREC
ncbi:Pentatricopeptide repeat-containing protein, mitochondrial [Ananas comosus]|uniref:Pentatricopeptide repeat-containing protein, mitochondrial n=1 Tax=Ananas comosus TaxID=4615 RepID=A0A199V3U1_ANACO|nr:Pentatricopeptide repeat-containing protein, mitochondrial [Ananas comosus]